jgi:hypothetical protein
MNYCGAGSEKAICPIIGEMGIYTDLIRSNPSERISMISGGKDGLSGGFEAAGYEKSQRAFITRTGLRTL